RIGSLEIVDLCEPLLERARERARHLPNLRASKGDAATWQPAQPVDCVYFSYSLTMIPAWRAALRNAIGMLKPGGVLGVVDFHVSAKNPSSGFVRHNALTRWFWPRWFQHDGVQLGAERVATLCDLLPDHELTEGRGSVPYLPFLRVPYFRFVGRKARVNPDTEVIRR
ncbi:MAG: class I SAM-dependent methyltransferase, partial [Dokdonella sp.]